MNTENVKINNVICHADVSSIIDLCKTAMVMNGRSNPLVFPASVYHCKTTQCTLSIFESGNLVIVGSGDEMKVLLAAHLFVWALRKWMKLDVGLFNFTVDNIVGNFSLPFQLNMDLFLADHPLEAQCNPDIFKGLSYKPYTPGPGAVVFVLFKSGKGIITGGKSSKALRDAYDDKIELFTKYRLGGEYRPLKENERIERPWLAVSPVTKTNKKRKLQ